MAASRRPSQQPLEGGVQVAGQLIVIRVTRAGQGPYDNQATGGQPVQPIAHEMTESALDLAAHDSDAHCLAHDETRTCRGNAFPRPVRVRCTAAKMNDKERAPGPASSAYRGRKVLAPPQPILGRQHVMDLGCCSGRQAGATLATAGREDRAAGTGPHAQTEAVGLRATAVVRLEGALAHSGAPGMLVVSGETDVGRRLAVTVRPRVARNA